MPLLSIGIFNFQLLVQEDIQNVSELVTIQYEIFPAASARQHLISSCNYLCIHLKKKLREIILIFDTQFLVLLHQTNVCVSFLEHYFLACTLFLWPELRC